MGVLANDVRATAVQSVRGEVDALDVVALLAARRFFPDAYDLIWKKRILLFTVRQLVENRASFPDRTRTLQAQAARVEAAIKIIAQNNQESPLYPLLSEMFPTPMSQLLARRKRSDTDDDFAESEKGKRISHPDYSSNLFPIRRSRSNIQLVENR